MHDGVEVWAPPSTVLVDGQGDEDLCGREVCSGRADLMSLSNFLFSRSRNTTSELLVEEDISSVLMLQYRWYDVHVDVPGGAPCAPLLEVSRSAGDVRP